MHGSPSVEFTMSAAERVSESHSGGEPLGEPATTSLMHSSSNHQSAPPTRQSANDVGDYSAHSNRSRLFRDNNDENNNNPNNNETVHRTPVPSDWQHARILIERSFAKDRSKPHLWLAKFVLVGALLMLYTIGIFISFEDTESGSVESGGFRFSEPKLGFEYPSTLRLAGFDAGYVATVAQELSANSEFQTILLNVTSVVNPEQLSSECQGINEFRQEICVFFDSDTSFRLHFGGQEQSVPFSSQLAASQWALSTAILALNGAETLPVVSQTQRTPQEVSDSNAEAVTAVLIVPAVMHVLSAIIMTQFLVGPISYEKLNEVSRSFILVGVKLRTYILQWILYYGINGLLTAGILTLISVFYKLISLSSPGLIFLSHYLGLIHLYSVFTLLMQLVTQEELAQGVPWLVGMVSIGAGAAILILQDPNFWVLTLLSVLSPYCGMLQYYGIYGTYDWTGFGTGIHAGVNVRESGLLANIVAQLLGIAIWIGLILFYSSASYQNWRNGHVDGVSASSDDDETDAANFEPLAPGSEVLLSVRGLQHTYGANSFGCSKNEPVEVLKGLDLDICRGEVFGYLGHNGAGKTTSVHVLAGEIPMQAGNVTYNFRRGSANLSKAEDGALIRNKIGVCPQHNTALQDDMSSREILRLFARLKGSIIIDGNSSEDEAIEAEVQRRLDDVQFTSNEDADKPIGTFSGGMKRKVLIAMALLGDPEVVYLDEPSAGLDPYNRRALWDMIISAKKGRCIILTTHFLDEADVLSDRIGIMKNGKLITCGSSLFLKHHFGAGYTLSYESDETVDISDNITESECIEDETEGVNHKWRLQHGSESKFPGLLSTLSKAGAINVSLQLTTLEQVFLETGKEDIETADEVEEEPQTGDVEELLSPRSKSHDLAKIWEPRGAVEPLSRWKKFYLVMHFMMTNAWKIKGTITLNIGMPLIYLVAGLVATSLIDVPVKGDLVTQNAIDITPFFVDRMGSYFGVSNVDGVNPVAPLVPIESPTAVEDYFLDQSIPVVGGYYKSNSTLQYASEISPFALQISIGALNNFTALSTGMSGINVAVQQLPYITEAPFRVDLLILPMCLAFGFAGLAFAVLDVLLLKGDNIIGLFRVAGITEWEAYLGVVSYKIATTFTPFFALVIVLGISLKSVLFGNGGRWLGTLFMMLAYAYSTGPMGLIFAKRLIHSDYKSVANWFPGVYMTLVGLPYIAWVSVLQALPEARNTLLIVGDIICVVPQVAFQRGMGAIIEISSKFDDPSLSWQDVWKFESRVWFAILMMTGVGSLEWLYLKRLTTGREPRASLKKENIPKIAPVSISHDEDIVAERTRSLADDEGINSRDLVKAFLIKPAKAAKSKDPIVKRSVKGVSFGVRANEIFALLGPNGAGKTVTMSCLAGQYTPENGTMALDGSICGPDERSSDHMYERCNIGYCPQFDALFPKKTVEEHLRFYATIRGLNWEQPETQDHIEAIVKLLGLTKHRDKESSQLSGGYKRRLSLGVAMLGYPKAMIVDECTTGVDTAARRRIWDVLKPSIQHDSYDLPAILLSSHYMDECQELGTRIGIMIDGAIATTGSLRRLQDLYCTNYFVEISLVPEARDNVEDKLLAIFEANGMPAKIYESLPFHFKLQVPFQEGASHDDTLQLANIFEILESNKPSLGVKFYSVALMNLEQIFIDLSRKQFEADLAFETQRDTGISMDLAEFTAY